MNRLNEYANKDLRVLMIDDSVADADLLDHELQRHGLAFRSRRVDTREALGEALHAFVPDLVFSDLTMPAFDGIEALTITREICPRVPFIYVSGTIGEERAIELLRHGATDYVLKQNLARLAPVVARALREADVARERRREKVQLRTLSNAVERIPSTIMITDATGRIEYVNPKFTEVTGYRAEEVIGQNPRLLSSGQMPYLTYEEMWRTILAGGEWRGKFHNRRKNGELYWESATISVICDEAGVITHFVAVKEEIAGRTEHQDQGHQTDWFAPGSRLTDEVHTCPQT